MKFLPLPLGGAFLIEPEFLEDDRGFFSRITCKEEFAVHGLESIFVQSSVSFNHTKGTLRGMHFQTEPYPEIKLVRCTMGSIFDVIVDLRVHSPTYQQWYGVEISAKSRTSIYIPDGFAHGFITLADNTEVYYQMTEFFHPECAAGVRYNDPALGIDWPIEVKVISSRDETYGDFKH